MAATQEILISGRQPSDRLQQAITACATGFKRLRDNINDAIEIGKQEGYTAKQVGDMIRTELAKNNFGDRSIRRYLPTEAKDQSKIRAIKENLRTELTAKANTRPLDIAELDFTYEGLQHYSKKQLISIILKLSEGYRHGERSEPNPTTQTQIVPSPENVERRTVDKSSFARNPINRTDLVKEQEVLRLHNEGFSTRKIQDKIGVSKSSVVRIINRYNTT